MIHADDILLIRANAHVYQRAEVLTDFEIQTIREAFDRRIVRLGAPVTADERRVISEAMDAMVSAGRQDLTDMGLAA